jgi:hypothetical protein
VNVDRGPGVLTGEVREAAKRLYALAIAGLVISPEDTRAVHVVLDELIRLSREAAVPGASHTAPEGAPGTANAQPNEDVNP